MKSNKLITTGIIGLVAVGGYVVYRGLKAIRDDLPKSMKNFNDLMEGLKNSDKPQQTDNNSEAPFFVEPEEQKEEHTNSYVNLDKYCNNLDKGQQTEKSQQIEETNKGLTDNDVMEIVKSTQEVIDLINEDETTDSENYDLEDEETDYDDEETEDYDDEETEEDLIRAGLNENTFEDKEIVEFETVPDNSLFGEQSGFKAEPFSKEDFTEQVKKHTQEDNFNESPFML